MNDLKALQALFVQRVDDLAKKNGWSHNRLANFADVSQGFLSEVMRCKRIPTLKTVQRLATALDVEPWELLRP